MCTTYDRYPYYTTYYSDYGLACENLSLSLSFFPCQLSYLFLKINEQPYAAQITIEIWQLVAYLKKIMNVIILHYYHLSTDELHFVYKRNAWTMICTSLSYVQHFQEYSACYGFVKKYAFKFKITLNAAKSY